MTRRPRANYAPITLGLTEAARLMGMSKDALRARIHAGEIHAFKIDPNSPRGHWHVRRAELDRWARAQSESQARQLRQVARNALSHPFPFGYEPAGMSPAVTDIVAAPAAD